MTMKWFREMFTKLTWRRRPPGALVHPRRWIRRYWYWVAGPLVIVLGVAAIIVNPFSPESPCGRGLATGDSPNVCVGLDRDSSGFGPNDPLTDLEAEIERQNDQVSGPATTLVLLDNMPPNPDNDSDNPRPLRHRVQGTLTAVQRANSTAASGSTKKFRLLLASYGSGAESWRAAVDAITQAQRDERIVAVTGIGQSLYKTRLAVDSLSQSGIATVGSVVTADDMTIDPEGKRIENFFRVAPNNSDEALAAVSYIADRDYKRIMLVEDINTEESYSRTLATAFKDAFRRTFHHDIHFVEPYKSPDKKLRGGSRTEYMVGQFAKRHSDLCANRPDLIYFAGRSADLRSFLQAQVEQGACELTHVDVLTGDDAANIVDDKVPTSKQLTFNVMFTALAHGDQWKSAGDRVNNANYAAFQAAFLNAGFVRADLVDGHAMMSHDAALTAITAVAGNELATSDPQTVATELLNVRCHNTVSGASGVIALDRSGNPIDKAMPILRIESNGSVVQQGLAWPTGIPLNPTTTCS
jgi:ABC-type branched-subunit amino acid transport system substrate-binding protein